MRVEGMKMGINYGTNKVRFPSTVPVGSRLRATAVLKSVEEAGGGVQVTAVVTVEREGGDKPACVAESVSRYYFLSPARGRLRHRLAATMRSTRSAYRSPTSSGVRLPWALNHRATSMQSESTASVVPGTSGTSNSPPPRRRR